MEQTNKGITMATIQRVELLQAMDVVISYLNNEEAYMTWINMVPDAATTEDFEDIAQDNELYEIAVNLFKNLVNFYGKDGWYCLGDGKAYGRK